MRIWLVVAIAVLVGGIAGLGIAQTEFAGVVEYFEPASREPTAATNAHRGEGHGPRVVVDSGTKYEFATIAYGSSSKHGFVVRNEGDEPLKLTFDHPSCGMCIEVKSPYDQVVIPPGESSELVINFSAKKSVETFNESAYYKTNDPLLSFLRLDITGIVTQAAKIVPGDLALGSVSASEGATTRLKLLGYRSTKFELIGTTFSDPATAEFFQFSTAEMSKEDAIAADKYATCGLFVDVTIKPGLPLGSLTQLITFNTRADAEHSLDLRVSGEVVGDIVVAGKDYRGEQDSLMMGINQRGVGRTTVVHLLIKGPHRHDVKLSLGEVDPANALQVTLSDGVPISDGKVIKHTLTVELKAHAPVMNRLGNEQGKAGQLVIETTHPTAKTIPMKVRFAVE